MSSPVDQAIASLQQVNELLSRKEQLHRDIEVAQSRLNLLDKELELAGRHTLEEAQQEAVRIRREADALLAEAKQRLTEVEARERVVASLPAEWDTLRKAEDEVARQRAALAEAQSDLSAARDLLAQQRQQLDAKETDVARRAAGLPPVETPAP